MSKKAKKKKQTTWIVKPGEIVMIGHTHIGDTDGWIEGHEPDHVHHMGVAAEEFDIFKIMAEYFTEVSKRLPIVFMSGGELGLADGVITPIDGQDDEVWGEYMRRVDPKRLSKFLKKHGYTVGGRWHSIPCSTVNQSKSFVMYRAGLTPTPRDIAMSRPRKRQDKGK